MASEIVEEEDEDPCLIIINTEARKEKIRQIIRYQKNLYLSSSSSSSFSSAAASCSSFSPSRRSSNLLELMRGGSTSLRRLFDMEHTSLGNHLNDYSCSPVIKPTLLWGSDTDDEIHDDPWMGIKQTDPVFDSRNAGQSGLTSEGSFMDEEESTNQKRKARMRKNKLTRTKSFRKLPSFRKWKWKDFRIRFRLTLRLRVMICGRKF